MAVATPISLPAKAQQGIIKFLGEAIRLTNRQTHRSRFRDVDLAYQRELDYTLQHQHAKTMNALGDPTKVQNVIVPVVMPQVEASVAYKSEVFLAERPIFRAVASAAYQDAAMQMETIIDDQATRGGWERELLLFFRDGDKYNFSAIEITWQQKVTYAVETDTATFAPEGKPKEVIWKGNNLRRCDPYNLIWDTRVEPTKVHEVGEFAGYCELMSRVQLKSYINSLPEKIISNVTPALESSIGGGETGNFYYTPDVNLAAFEDAQQRHTTNWLAWAMLEDNSTKINYKDLYEVYTLYARIIPADFGIRVPAVNTPQIWKFIIVNGSILIYAERQTNAHDYLPILIGQPQEDGLTYQTKSLAANVKPFQDISSAFMNSIIASRRRAIADRGLYDPSRVSENNINSDNPSAKIPVRPSAFGKPLSEAYFPIPYRDDQSGELLSGISLMSNFANITSGQNPARQGQFVKGNKTRDEFSSIMGNASARDKMSAKLLEAQVFTPLKHIIKTNILQYQGGTSLYNKEKNSLVTIDPVVLRKAIMEFKITDGLTPADRLLHVDVLQVALQAISSSQVLAAEYNLAPLFSYLVKTQGAAISDFEKSREQVAYEQAVMQWQQLIMQLFQQNPELRAEQLPPQPVPEQYGYDPQSQIQPKQQPQQTILEQVNATQTGE